MDVARLYANSWGELYNSELQHWICKLKHAFISSLHLQFRLHSTWARDTRVKLCHVKFILSSGTATGYRKSVESDHEARVCPIATHLHQNYFAACHSQNCSHPCEYARHFISSLWRCEGGRILCKRVTFSRLFGVLYTVKSRQEHNGLTLQYVSRLSKLTTKDFSHYCQSTVMVWAKWKGNQIGGWDVKFS